MTYRQILNAYRRALDLDRAVAHHRKRAAIASDPAEKERRLGLARQNEIRLDTEIDLS